MVPRTEQKTQRTRKAAKKIVIDFYYGIVGSLCYAISVNVFTAPNHILLGGFTGIATMLNYLLNIPIGTAIFLMNIPLFLIAFYKFGSGFVIRTMLATFMASSAIDLTAPILPAYLGNKVLATIFGGFFCGAGLAFFFLRNTTSGGMDIIAKLVRLRYPQFSMGKAILALDFFVLLASYFVYHSLDNLLYAVLVIFVSTKTIDAMLYGMGSGKLLYIITKEPEKLTEQINSQIHRGVSIVKIQGGYTGKEQKMLFCVVRTHEMSNIIELIRIIDKEAFVTISDVGEIYGTGFQMVSENF